MQNLSLSDIEEISSSSILWLATRTEATERRILHNHLARSLRPTSIPQASGSYFSDALALPERACELLMKEETSQ